MKISPKMKNRINVTASYLKYRLFGTKSLFTYVNLAVVVVQFLYVFLRFPYVNAQIPFWYTSTWGEPMLASKTNLWWLPAVGLGIFVLGYVLNSFNKYFVKFLRETIQTAVFLSNSFLLISLVKIVRAASLPFPSMFDLTYSRYIIPFLASFVIVYAVLPWFIDMAFRKKLVTNPDLHTAPAMILKQPSARGGGFVYALVFVLMCSIYPGFTGKFMGLYVSVLLLAILGLFDDYQNTHPFSKFKVLENPALRLLLLFASVSPAIFSGIRITSIGNIPFGMLQLSYLISIGLSFVWIVWILNLLSWAKGVDGQYSGIIGISSIFLMLLALRFDKLSEYHYQLAYMGAVSAGAAFAFTKYNWHPSKIMWGFGATSAGMVLAGLSISVQGKVIASLLFILVPFMDAVVTVLRRLLMGKNPLSGDRGHLHHLLLDRGWSPQKIAKFYWLCTFATGSIGMLASEKYLMRVSLILAGVVAFVIILLNLRSVRGKQPTQSIV